MKQIFVRFERLWKSRILWFFVGLMVIPLSNYFVRIFYPTTSIEAMGWVSHYEERKHIFTLLPDFSDSLRFPGNREKFVKRMGLEDYKISEGEYK